jgi:hypothetical protein
MTRYLDPSCDFRISQNRDLAREAARVRFIAAATRQPATVAPRPVGRVRASMRQAVVSLVALVAIG